MKYPWPRYTTTYVIFFIALLWVPVSHIDRIYAEFPETQMCQAHAELGAQVCDVRNSIISVNNPDDYTPLITTAGTARFVLIGDSTHGSHEFYLERINISKRLITEQNFTLIAIEGNWSCEPCPFQNPPGVESRRTIRRNKSITARAISAKMTAAAAAS